MGGGIGWDITQGRTWHTELGSLGRGVRGGPDRGGRRGVEWMKEDVEGSFSGTQ